MTKPCSDCPFMKSSPLVGSPEWLEDILNCRKRNQYFKHSCHKTDKNADGFNHKSKKMRECKGHIMIMMNSIDGMPGKGGVYSSLDEMFEIYLRHWLGDNEYEKIRTQSQHLEETGK